MDEQHDARARRDARLPPQAGPPADGTAQAPAGPADPAADDAAVDGADRARRAFFRSFSRDAIQTLAGVVGMAAAAQKSAGAAAGEILGLVAAPPPDAAPSPPAPPASGAAGDELSAPYRVHDAGLVLLDQRHHAAAGTEVTCTTCAEVVGALEGRVVHGAAAKAEVAAFGLWLAALGAADMSHFARLAIVRGGARALRESCPNVAAVGWALDRVLATWERAIADGAGGIGAAEAAHAEAASVAADLATAHAAIARSGAAALAERMPAEPDRTLEILTLDSTGRLAGGRVGTALGVITALHAEGRQVHVWLLETRPSLSGAQLAAQELIRAGVDTTVVPDAVAGALLSTTRVDAVLVGADRIAADGATTAVVGTYPLAVLASRHGAEVWVLAPLATVDPTVAGAAGSATARGRYDMPRATILHGSLAGPDVDGPLQDVTPPELIAAILTEAGVLRTPFGQALRGAGEEPAAESHAG